MPVHVCFCLSLSVSYTFFLTFICLESNMSSLLSPFCSSSESWSIHLHLTTCLLCSLYNNTRVTCSSALSGHSSSSLYANRLWHQETFTPESLYIWKLTPTWVAVLHKQAFTPRNSILQAPLGPQPLGHWIRGRRNSPRLFRISWKEAPNSLEESLCWQDKIFIQGPLKGLHPHLHKIFPEGPLNLLTQGPLKEKVAGSSHKVLEEDLTRSFKTMMQQPLRASRNGCCASTSGRGYRLDLRI